MFVLDAKVKERFFDRAAVVKATADRERRALSKIGAFVRRRAQTDILRRTGGRRGPKGRDRRGRFKQGLLAARPGQPPIVHSRSKYATLRNILFALSADGQAVVIGPVGIASLRLRKSSAQTVPELMEFGGSAEVEEFSTDGGLTWALGKNHGWNWQSRSMRRKRWARYQPHPFMGPALDKEVAAGTVLNAFGYGNLATISMGVHN